MFVDDIYSWSLSSTQKKARFEKLVLNWVTPQSNLIKAYWMTPVQFYGKNWLKLKNCKYNTRISVNVQFEIWITSIHEFYITYYGYLESPDKRRLWTAFIPDLLKSTLSQIYMIYEIKNSYLLHVQMFWSNLHASLTKIWEGSSPSPLNNEIGFNYRSKLYSLF